MATREVGEVVSSEEQQQHRWHGSSSGTVRERRRKTSNGDEEHGEEQLLEQLRNKKLRLAVRVVIAFILFVVVLGCVALSKLTLIALADELRHKTVGRTKNELKESSADIARIFWQLVVILVVPHILTFLRSAVVGVIGKTRIAYPWPGKRALLAGAASSIVEVVAMNVFVFSVLCHLPPELALLSMQPVFVAQFLLDVWYTPCNIERHNCSRGGYTGVGDGSTESQTLPDLPPEDDVQPRTEPKCYSKLGQILGLILENKITKTVALLLQIAGTAGILTIVILNKKAHQHYLVPVIGLPLSVATLAILWTNKFQEFLSAPQMSPYYQAPESESRVAASARYKANFLNSLYRIILYPPLAYGVFRGIHHNGIDPWAGSMEHFLGAGPDLTFFLTHILTSFFGYVFAWIACLMTIRRYGFGLPLLLSTPLALVLGLFTSFFKEFSVEYILRHENLYSLGVWFAVYLGQILGMAYFLCSKNNLILSQDKDMFLNPHYESVFLEQYLSLNRQVGKYSEKKQETKHGESSDPRAIFICSTMYRENVQEMRQMLKSIKRMSDWYDDQQRRAGNRAEDTVESHIFFDGAVNGGQLTQYAMQLLSLVSDCLDVKLTKCICKETHYGQLMSWDVGQRPMKFTVHFKDNLKVKNKKRWSQVMYMNYIIKYRIKKSEGTPNPLDQEHTFILTTDADIDFTAESAMVLLDSLASDKEVGAVCARTHPKGSGVVYWYQIFDYAIGHWFIKPVEHLFGSVLCCPGCFSVFRCKALEEVLEEYSSDVQGAADFLTKDMGEDRWLCTLLIQKGWRLNYCAISEDHTYCPETFDEFYKQRRRWVPSTIANLLLLISKAKNITSANNSVSWLFIIFQAVMVFSTAISPATVILIIASGLQGAYQISNGAVLATIIILTLLSVFYGVICLYTSQKTQIDVAKFLTFLFAILMVIVFVGIFKQIILEVFPVDNGLQLLHPPACKNASNTDCLRAQNNLGVSVNTSTPFKSVRLPTSPTTWYVALFAVTYTAAALLHPREITGLVHCVWYILALPSGYLLLLIYSAVNLDSQSWGTRETPTGGGRQGGGFRMVGRWLREGVKGTRELCCGRRGRDEETEQKTPLLQEEEAETGFVDQKEAGTYPSVAVKHRKMKDDAKQWLEKQECLEYMDKFEENGYWNLSYIASMRRKEFKAIGLEKLGFLLRLEKAAKKLPAMVIETDVPPTVTEWLKTLDMEEYTQVFHSAGFKTEADVENLKEIDEQELKRMGIVKIAHVQRLKKALDSIFHPTAVEVKIHNVKKALSSIQPSSIHDDDDDDDDDKKNEAKFWKKILSRELKPVTVHLQQASKEIGQKLKSLRNSTLALMFIINMMWIILLYTVTLPQLVQYGLPDRAFQLLFLAVYGIIVLVSFVAMLMHRFLMLIHFLGRPEVLKEAIQEPHEEPVLLETSHTYRS